MDIGMKTKIGLGILLVAVAMSAGCTDEKKESSTIIEIQESAINAPQTTEVTRGDLEVSITVDALVGPRIEQLTFEEKGEFSRFCVNLGQEVQAGDVIALSISRATEKSIEEKQRELENLKRDYEYQRAMLESNIELLNLQVKDLDEKIVFEEKNSPMYNALSVQTGRCREERKKLELELKQLGETFELELAHLEKQLANLIEKKDGNVIKAPYDGVIVALASVAYGDAIDTELYYAAIADTSVCYARCGYVNQWLANSMQEIVFWKDGKEYSVEYLPMDDKIYAEKKNNEETLYSEFVITEPKGEIEYGDYGKIKLISARKQDVLLLPAHAVLADETGNYVYMDVEGSRQRVAVKKGSSDGILVEITEGLQEGDVVYVQE